jgi:predicted ATPase/DNA-binding SARP family transcriptional activator
MGEHGGVKVQLLGPVQVRSDSGDLLEIRGARLRALLARLALAAGEVVPAATLVGDLWGESAPGTNALHTLVSRLRRDLAGDPSLRSHPAGYQLVIARDDVDALRGEDLAAQARTALAAPDWATAQTAARSGLALFHGPALSDIGDPPYAVGAGSMLDQLKIALTEDLADALIGVGGQPDLAELAAVARANPLRERLQGALIRALYAAGRQADALEAYERTRHRLADELGIDPSPQLEAIHLAVLRQDAAVLPPSAPSAASSTEETGGPADQLRAGHGNLRTSLTSFVGREDEVTRVSAALAGSRLVTLVGPGGAGKTRLALETGRRLESELPAGVWLVELAPVHEPVDLGQAVLAALGLRERRLLDHAGEGRAMGVVEPADAIARLVEALAGAELLIVLDNCEHLIAAVAELADQVLAVCPKVRLLATSREPLGITGETLCPLPPLALPPVDADAEQAMTYAAVRLLADRAVAVQPAFTVDESNVAAVVSICRRLDGLPLAIELAAARVRAMSAQQIAARLDDRFRLLTGGSRTALPRHRTLLAVVEWSWDLLEKPERLLLQRLAVFAGPVRLELVESICADEELLPEADVLDVLATLVDKSLVDAIGAGDVRYRMLETVRAFASEHLAESGEAAAVRDRHAEYLLDLAEQAEPLLRSKDELEWLARLDAVRDDLFAAMRWCIDSGAADRAVRFVAALGWYLHLRGMTSEMSHWPREALALDGAVDPKALAITHAFLAMGSAGEGDLAAGSTALAAAVEQAALMRDRSTHPLVALLEPATHMFTGQLDEGMAAVERIVTTHPDQWTRGVALILQGHAMENAGDMKAVPPCYVKAFAIFSALGERWGQAISLSSLGEVQEGNGDYLAALEGYERALAYLRELGTLDDVTMTLTRLARMRLLTGDRAGAQSALAEAREAADRFNQPAQSAIVEMGYAGLARADGDLAHAERLLRGVMVETGGGGFAPLQLPAMIAASLAVVLVAGGQFAEARELLASALAFGRRSRDVPVLAEVVASWAALAQAEGDAVWAARILGFAAAVRGIPLPPVGDAADVAAAAREQLPEAEFTAAYDEGAGLDRDAAIEALLSWSGLTSEQLDELAQR